MADDTDNRLHPSGEPFPNLPEPVRQYIATLLGSSFVESAVEVEPVLSGGYRIGRSRNPRVWFQVASRKHQPIAAGDLIQQAILAPKFPVYAPVVGVLKVGNELLHEIDNGEDDTWYLMFRNPTPGRCLEPAGDEFQPLSFRDYRNLLDLQDAWTQAFDPGAGTGLRWANSVPFYGLDPNGDLATVAAQLPDFVEWRRAYGHQSPNFDGLAWGINDLKEKGLSDSVAPWLLENWDWIRKNTEHFAVATRGPSLVNGPMSTVNTLVPPARRNAERRFLCTDFGELSFGHPFATYMFAAYYQYCALRKAGREREWQSCEEELFCRLGNLDTWTKQIQSHAAGFGSQLLATQFRLLPRENPPWRHAGYLQLAAGMLPLINRWMALGDENQMVGENLVRPTSHDPNRDVFEHPVLNETIFPGPRQPAEPTL